ncbi:guanylate kinase [Candidatus Desulfofervidus auxilii]|uniref:Guanylate kinase n=1 Tax=Desulfofervidus auxilii TaxID=1621989 RepID=A0A7U4QM56_DESA2|nr:guanylate kinase [Candidatus Desulfofervidus auxilii]AMM41856.1 guanylate kinase [Candidatus Desulfofervidus auxilii]
MKNKGDIFVISAPSGTGKTTLVRLLLSRFPTLSFSISYTTRLPRPGEVNGQHYFFVSEKEFKKSIAKGEMLEWAKVYGHYYGTPLTFVQEKIAAGKDIVLDIDIQGAQAVKKKMPEAILIFLIPPSWNELQRRIISRSSDSPEEIKKRLEAAKKEILAAREFDYIVINDVLEDALKELVSIIQATKARANKRWPEIKRLLQA